MAKYMVSYEAVGNLRLLADTILLNGVGIESSGIKLIEEVDNLKDGLGIYAELIDDIVNEGNEVLDRLLKLANKLFECSNQVLDLVQLNELEEHRRVVYNELIMKNEIDEEISELLHEGEANDLEDMLDSDDSADIFDPNIPIKQNCDIYKVDEKADNNEMLKNLLVCFVVETSGKVSEIVRNVIRTAIEELIPEMRDVWAANIFCRTLTYNIGARWVEPNAVNIMEYNGMPPSESFGFNNFGEACYKLNDYLNDSNIVNGEIRFHLCPIIVYIFASEPTGEYLKGVNRLKQNRFYKICHKYHYVFGNENIRAVFGDLLGDDSIQLPSLNNLKSEIIRRCAEQILI